MAKIKVTRKDYTRKGGTKVKGSTYLSKDKGKPGKTPEGEKWYEHGAKMGWSKNDSAETRRGKALRAHKGDELATARALQALANVTTDPETKKLAAKGADYFFAKHK